MFQSELSFESNMTTIVLDTSPAQPYASLRAIIGIARILQVLKRRLKSRLQRCEEALKPSVGRPGGTRKSRASSQLHKLLNELENYTRFGKGSLSKAAADEEKFIRHDLRFNATGVSLCGVTTRCLDIVSALLGQFNHHCQGYGDTKLAISSRNESDLHDLTDEKYTANLEHLLRCLQHLHLGLLLEEQLELLDLEALYWQQHLDDGFFAQRPAKHQQLSTTWPWNIRTPLLVLWGVCWMFYDSLQGLSGGVQNGTLTERPGNVWPVDETTTTRDTQVVTTQSLARSAHYNSPPASWFRQEAPNAGSRISEPLNAAPQTPRQQGYDYSIVNIGGQRLDESSSSWGLYNQDPVPQNIPSFSFETAPTLNWLDTSFDVFCPSLDAWQTQYNQLCQQPIPFREVARSLPVQASDAASPTVGSGTYPPKLSWSVQENNSQDPDGTEYYPPMPDSDDYPSPASEGSSRLLDLKKPSLDRWPVAASIGEAKQPSPSPGGNVGRPKLSMKRDQEPPRNESGQITCNHQDCSRDEVPTFLRKCEWSKHMDKHDRPYVCTEEGCETMRGFTYSGGLLRHQREVHKKHGGPKAPLMCPHKVCKRSAGKGFTRKENLVEHLRRVHQKDGPDHHAIVHEERSDLDGKGAEDTSLLKSTTTRKRKRSLDDLDGDAETYTLAPISRDAGGDLREEVKRLRREIDARDGRLRDLETFVATLKEQQMQRCSS